MKLRYVAWALLVVLVGSLGVTGAVAWHEGYRLYAVRTGSMTPTYPTGAVVLDKPLEATMPPVGQVVTFSTKDGLVTHRVYGIAANGFKTKGDANRKPDAWTVPTKNLVGEVVAGVPFAGYALVFFKQPTGALSLMLLLTSVVFAWSIFFGTPTSPSGPAAPLAAAGPRQATRRRHAHSAVVAH